VPIHRGYYIEDARTVEVGPWADRKCNAAILVLAGQEGVSEARITEIPPGGTTEPVRFALDEAVYVVEGRGLTTVWADGQPKTTFEWQKHSMFLLPHGHVHQLSNAQGNQPARLLHYNYLPIAMAITPDTNSFFRLNERPVSEAGQNDRFLDSFLYSTNGPIKLKGGLFSQHWAARPRDIETFLRRARLHAVYELKESHVCEHIEELTLGPVRNQRLTVKFRGRRAQRYSNEPPFGITLDGQCPLQAVLMLS